MRCLKEITIFQESPLISIVKTGLRVHAILRVTKPMPIFFMYSSRNKLLKTLGRNKGFTEVLRWNEMPLSNELFGSHVVILRWITLRMIVQRLKRKSSYARNVSSKKREHFREQRTRTGDWAPFKQFGRRSRHANFSKSFQVVWEGERRRIKLKEECAGEMWKGAKENAFKTGDFIQSKTTTESHDINEQQRSAYR